jgi:hypothetical protein
VADLSDARSIDLRSILDFGLRHGEINGAVGAFLRGLPPYESRVRAQPAAR